MVDASENGEYPVLSMYRDGIIEWAANIQRAFVKDNIMLVLCPPVIVRANSPATARWCAGKSNKCNVFQSTSISPIGDQQRNRLAHRRSAHGQRR
jgi:hypothetical protein